MENTFITQNTSVTKPAPAVERAFRILKLLGQAKEPQGVSAIARDLGIGKSTVHGILKALFLAGAIEDVGGRHFRLGPLIEDLASQRRGARTLSDISQPHLAALVEKMDRTAMFGVPDGDRFRIVTVVEGRGSLQVEAVQGGYIPLLAGATGKVALAWEVVPMPEVLPCFTEGSVVDAVALCEELKRVREDKLALDRGEFLRGVYAAASPILRGDTLMGILFSAGFQDQLGEEGLLAIGNAVKQTARAVSKELLEWKVEK